MILVVGFALMALTVPLWGGRLTRLTELRLVGVSLAVGALLLQIVVINLLPAVLPHAVAAVLHLVSYGLAVAFLFRNRKVFGLPLLGFGGILNLIAIGANGGVMPASPRALAVAGFDPAVGQFQNSTAVAGAKVAFLGDVFAVPEAWPLSNVYSIGDVLLLVGATVVMHAAVDSHLAKAVRRLADRLRDRLAGNETVASASAGVDLAAADDGLVAVHPGPKPDAGAVAAVAAEAGEETVAPPAEGPADWITAVFNEPLDAPAADLGWDADGEVAPAPAPAAVDGCDVLVLCRDVDAARRYRALLTERGWTVDRASDVDDVVFAMAELDPPRLILVDEASRGVVPVAVVLGGAWSAVDVVVVADPADAVASTLRVVGPARELASA